MRTDWCRQHIDETAKHCGLSEEAVREVKRAAEFVAEHPELAEMPTRPLTILIRTKDKKVQKSTIDRVGKILKAGQRPSETEIRDLVDVIKEELGKSGTPKPSPKTPRTRESTETPPGSAKENQLTDVIGQMRANPPQKPPFPGRAPGNASVKPTPSIPTTFDIRKRFPMPGTREEILFRAQLDDIGMRTKGWMKNPDLAPLIPTLQELRRKAREIYGELVGREE